LNSQKAELLLIKGEVRGAFVWDLVKKLLKGGTSVAPKALEATSADKRYYLKTEEIFGRGGQSVVKLFDKEGMFTNIHVTGKKEVVALNKDGEEVSIGNLVFDSATSRGFAFEFNIPDRGVLSSKALAAVVDIERETVYFDLKGGELPEVGSISVSEGDGEVDKTGEGNGEKDEETNGGVVEEGLDKSEAQFIRERTGKDISQIDVMGIDYYNIGNWFECDDAFAFKWISERKNAETGKNGVVEVSSAVNYNNCGISRSGWVSHNELRGKRYFIDKVHTTAKNDIRLIMSSQSKAEMIIRIIEAHSRSFEGSYVYFASTEIAFEAVAEKWERISLFGDSIFDLDELPLEVEIVGLSSGDYSSIVLSKQLGLSVAGQGVGVVLKNGIIEINNLESTSVFEEGREFSIGGFGGLDKTKIILEGMDGRSMSNEGVVRLDSSVIDEVNKIIAQEEQESQREESFVESVKEVFESEGSVFYSFGSADKEGEIDESKVYVYVVGKRTGLYFDVNKNLNLYGDERDRSNGFVNSNGEYDSAGFGSLLETSMEAILSDGLDGKLIDFSRRIELRQDTVDRIIGFGAGTDDSSSEGVDVSSGSELTFKDYYDNRGSGDSPFKDITLGKSGTFVWSDDGNKVRLENSDVPWSDSGYLNLELNEKFNGNFPLVALGVYTENNGWLSENLDVQVINERSGDYTVFTLTSEGRLFINIDKAAGKDQPYFIVRSEEAKRAITRSNINNEVEVTLLEIREY
jgi:hypothetical protein